MSLPEISGVVPIVATPFDESGQIDEKSLRRLVDYCLDAGVHGLGIALGSEIYKLTEAERDLVISTVVDQTRGRVPVIVNTGAAATDLAVWYSKRAETLGAAAVMCMPPGAGFSAMEVTSYYRAISDAVSIPIMIQDTATTPVPAALIRAIGDSCERVCYAKVESTPPSLQIYNAVSASGDAVAIFGGAAGQAFLQELRRGSIGTMPWPSTPHAFVRVWNCWQAGDVAGATEIFDREIEPLLRISAGSLGAGHLIHKEVLRRQGVIASGHVRRPIDPLDPMTLEELDEVCVRLGFTQVA
ncbi:MAG: dihydrodipicolinate synthase family protein [Thermomicrobiales bacterium]